MSSSFGINPFGVDTDQLTGCAFREFPVLREKVQRVITQGYIDPEDFKGVSISSYQVPVQDVVEYPLLTLPFRIKDPEMNILGQRGIHAKTKKAKASEDGEEEVCLSINALTFLLPADT